MKVSSLKYLNKYLFKYRYRLLFGLLFIILANFFATVQGPVIREVIDFLSVSFREYNQIADPALREEYKSTFWNEVMNYALLIIGLALVSGIFLYFQRQMIIGVSRLIEFDLKNEIYKHYQELPISFYRRNNTGDLVARISEDVNQVRMYLGPAIMYGANLFVLLIIVLTYMLNVNVRLTIYTLLPLPLLSLSIYYVSGLINKRSTKIQEGLAQLSTYIQETFSGIRVIKAYVREKETSQRFEDLSNNYRARALRLVRVDSVFFPLVLLLTGLSTIIVIYAGGIRVISGEITFGNIVEFIFYLNKLTWPFTSLGWVTSLVQRAEASQKRINEFLNTKSDIVSEKDLKEPIQGNITFKKVNFTYPDTGIKALKDVSFDIKAGESIGIIGGTGSGKTTIANLICRLFDVTDGKILIDGKNIKEYNVGHLRKHIGYVPQDVFLFSDTIRNNLTFGTGDLPEDALKKFSRDAGLHENIKGFPKKFETVLGERGITLSGGQKQRLSIARAIAREPQILILDDSLSAVDTKTENDILNSLREIMQDRTTIIVSHRISTVKLANHVIVLEEGRIAEEGSHESLVQKGGIYEDMYKKQLAGVDDSMIN